MKQQVECVNASGFNYISENKKYDVIKETRDYVYIQNDAGMEKRYGKNRFNILETKEPRKKRKETSKTLKCIFPKYQICSLHKSYEVTKSEDEDKWKITGDDGGKHDVLKTRFDEE
jgi:hypothetical protein